MPWLSWSAETFSNFLPFEKEGRMEGVTMSKIAGVGEGNFFHQFSGFGVFNREEKNSKTTVKADELTGLDINSPISYTTTKELRIKIGFFH